MRSKLKTKVKSETYNYDRTVDSTSTDYLQNDYFEKMSTKTDYTYSRSPSYRRKAESPYYQMPNMSRAHVRGSVVNNTTTDLYVSSDEEDMNYVTGQRLSTRTVIEEGILLRSGNSLKNARTVTERHNVRSRRSLQALNTNKNAMEVRRSLQSLHTIDNSRESRSTTRRSRSRQSQASDYVTSTNQISRTGSSSASVSSYSSSSSKSSIMQPVRKTLIQEFDDLEMEKGMKEIQNSNRKIKLYGLDQVDSDEMSGMESEVEFTGTNMSSYRSHSQYSRNSSRQSRSDTTTATTSHSSSSVATTVTTTTTVITTIIETLASTARPVAEPVWNHVGQPIWNRVGEPVWRYLGRPVWQYLGRPLCSLISRLLTTVLLLMYHLTWTCSLRPIVNAGAFVTKKVLRTSRFVLVKMFIWEVGLFSRMSRRSRLCCLLLPFLLLLPLLFYAAYPLLMRTNLMGIWRERSLEDFSGIGGLSQHELKEHVRRIVIQINQVKENSLSVQEVERIVTGMVEQRLNEEKLTNQKQWLEELEAARQRAEETERTNITEEILRVLQQLNVRGDSLSEGDIRAIVGQVVQHEVTGLQDRITEQTQTKVSGDEKQEEKMLSLHNDLRTSIANLEEKLSIELNKVKSDSLQDGNSQTDVSASLVQIQDELASVQARLDNLELDKTSLAGHLKNCCQNDSFYTNLVRDQVNLVLGQVMSGNNSASSDYPTFEAWVNSTYIKKSDFEKYLAEFSQELTDRIMREMPGRETTEVYVSETGGQGTVTEGVVRQIVTDALEKFSADKIAMPDFALESAGGSIISTKCSETFHKNTARISILGIPLWYVSNSPRSVIQPEMQPGSCWAFQGSKGHLVIELSANITPTAFTMEHIPKSIAPDGKIDSAPKDFIVLGLSNEYDIVGTNLGNFTYLDSGPPLQTFSITKPNVGIYKFIQLSVFSNHGNPLYTCIYRFRVHGIPKPKKKGKS